MNTLETLQQQHRAAQNTLDELKADLPRFHSLLTDNEQEANRLKQDKADLDKQAQAKGRVNVAREMLQQHQADIGSTQAETERLEALIDREHTLLKLVELSKTAKAERAQIDEAFTRVAKVLQKTTLTITEAWQRENEARQAFADTGAQLMPNLRDSSQYFTSNAQENARRKSFLKELETRGAEIDAICDGATGTFTYFDKYAVNDWSRDAVSVSLWEAIRKLAGTDQAAHSLRRLTPARPSPSADFRAILEE